MENIKGYYRTTGNINEIWFIGSKGYVKVVRSDNTLQLKWMRRFTAFKNLKEIDKPRKQYNLVMREIKNIFNTPSIVCSGYYSDYPRICSIRNRGILYIYIYQR